MIYDIYAILIYIVIVMYPLSLIPCMFIYTHSSLKHRIIWVLALLIGASVATFLGGMQANKGPRTNIGFIFLIHMINMSCVLCTDSAI